jgi:hypothetical protein
VPFLSRRPPRRAAQADGSIDSLTSRNHSGWQTRLRPGQPSTTTHLLRPQLHGGSPLSDRVSPGPQPRGLTDLANATSPSGTATRSYPLPAGVGSHIGTLSRWAGFDPAIQRGHLDRTGLTFNRAQTVGPPRTWSRWHVRIDIACGGRGAVGLIGRAWTVARARGRGCARLRACRDPPHRCRA